MRRALILAVVVVAAALAGVWAASAVAPCALPPALMAKIALDKSAACSAPAQASVDQPRAVEPPAVTVVPAVKREFVDRLFVSGTLVAREEAQVAARIDGLTIVEVDAEDGDRVKRGRFSPASIAANSTRSLPRTTRRPGAPTRRSTRRGA